MPRKTENFCNNIIFENHFVDKNSKVLGNQNLKLMYDFDFNTYLDLYLGALKLRSIFAKYLNAQL